MSAGCGGESSPTSVSSEDLTQSGSFWSSLSPDLKDELIDFGKDKLSEERPEGASSIQAVRSSELVDEIDGQYENDSKSDAEIYDTYVEANDQALQEDFSELIPGLESGG